MSVSPGSDRHRNRRSHWHRTGLGSKQFEPLLFFGFHLTIHRKELGVLGTGAVLLLLLFLIIRGINLALSAKNLRRVPCLWLFGLLRLQSFVYRWWQPGCYL